MSVQAILLPLFVQVGLTFVLLIMLAAGRVPLVMAGTVDHERFALTGEGFPPAVQKLSSAFRNQFEVPVLFYVLTVLAMATRQADTLFVVMAWLFVASRIVQAAIHCTSNTLALRGAVFFVGVVILLAMWIIYASRILFAAVP
jgi:hypothetical protein